MSQRLRISAISYLNTAPLMWDFEHGDAGSRFEIAYTVPSQCAVALDRSEADIGIIPAAAYTTVADLAILPGVAIAAKNSIRSILLVCKVPLEKVHRVALDTSSLTSVALTKILFEKFWGGGRSFHSMPPDIDAMLQQHDAALVIGDPALKIDRSRYLTFDLADEWIRLTGKPFVFAFWAVRREANPPADLAKTFQLSRDHGMQDENLHKIVREWAPKVGLSELETEKYLTENVYYHLDNDCLAGLQLFYQYAHECGALPPAPSLRFL